MKQLKKSQYVMIGALAMIALYPLATSVDGSSFDIELPASLSLRREVIEHQADFRVQRREYSRVREVCLERAKTDDTVECPDFNDPFAVRKFLQTQEMESEGSEAVDEGNVMLRLIDLDSYQRGLLRRYHRVNSCPQSLNGILPGFYELCLSYISQMHPKFQGLVNDRANAARMKQNAADAE